MTTRSPSASSLTRRFAGLLGAALFGLVLSLATIAPYSAADAAPRGGFGSRGSRTFQAPPTTTTAPRTAAPIERTAAPRPGTPAQPGAARGGFMSGFGGTMLKGLLIGGLIGALMGSGFGGMAGILGLVLQFALIGGAIYLVMRFLRSRQQPQPGLAGAGAGPAPGPMQGHEPLARSGAPLGAGLGQMGGAQQPYAEPAPYAPAAEGPNDTIGLTGEDFDAFERILGEVQTAFGRADVEYLKTLTTQEAHAALAEQIGEMASQGLVNEIRDVKLLQGDLAEAWRDGNVDFATVALRFEMIDATRERATGRVVEGDAEHPTEVTQVWTFMRERSFGRPGAWRLSAMQDA